MCDREGQRHKREARVSGEKESDENEERRGSDDDDDDVDVEWW